MLPKQIAGISIPDSTLAAEATEMVRDTESELLFNHSLRVYLFGALQGRRLGLTYDPELLYIGAIFHDMGLTEPYRSPDERFEWGLDLLIAGLEAMALRERRRHQDG